MKMSYWMEQVPRLSADLPDYVARISSTPSLDLTLNSLFPISIVSREAF